MLIIGRENWREHRVWCAVSFGIISGCVAWYCYSAQFSEGWPGGGSVPGLAFGVVGGAIIAFEMFLSVRKKLRAVRIGRVKYWLKAHIWLGIVCFPILLLHSGFRLNSGPLAIVLMVLLTFVTVSGLFGLYLQQIIPKMMLEKVKGETIHSQIDHVLSQSAANAERMVRLACGIDREETNDRSEQPEDRRLRVVGAIRSSGTFQGRSLKTIVGTKSIQEAKPLHQFYLDTIAPYFQPKPPVDSPLASPKRSAALFADLRSRITPEAHSVIDTLQELCDERRQFTEQARLHNWLHGWLCVHVPLSTALFLLMFVHIYLALRYL